MTFLSPLYLLALLGALVPIVIHLLASRLAKGRAFSSLVFLIEIEQSALRWARLQERRLLAARILLVISVALALARPTCGTNRDPDSTLFAIDVSASMGAADGMVWSKALSTTTMAFDRLGAETAGLAVAGGRLNVIANPGERHADVLERMRQLSPGTEALNVSQVLLDASHLALERGHERIRLVVVSDFQRANWEGIAACPQNVDLWGIPVDGVRSNLAIDRVSLLGIAGTEHGSVEIRGSVRQYGDFVADSCALTFRWEDDEQTIVLPLLEGETAFIRRIGGAPPGLKRGELLLEDHHGLPLDNKMSLALLIPARQNVVIVGAGSEEARRVALALDPGGTEDSGFAVTEMPPGALDTRVLETAHCVVLLQDPGSPEGWDQILGLWKRGVGLILVADRDGFAQRESRFVEQVMGSVPDNAVLGPGQSTLQSGYVDYDHPIVSPFRDFATEGLSLPAIWRLRPWRGDHGVTIIGLQQGTPLLMERMTSSFGRALLWLTGFVPPWSDWSSRASFVPLWRRTVGYACGLRAPQPVVLGEQAVLDVPCTGRECTFRLEYPDGSMLRLVPETIVPPVARIRLGPFLEPGLHVLWSDEGPIRLLVTEVAESERTAEVASTRPIAVERWLEPKEIDEERFKRPEAWAEGTRFLLLVALVVLAAETFLAAITTGTARRSQ